MSIDQVYTLNNQMTEMTTTTETLTNNIKNLQENFDSKLEILRNGWKFNPKSCLKLIYLFDICPRNKLTFSQFSNQSLIQF